MDIKEKLEVIAHLGDHISYKEDIGICYDSDLAKVIEDAYMELKNGVTVQEWISVKDRLPDNDYEKPLKDRKRYNVVVCGLVTTAVFGYKQHGWWIDFMGYTFSTEHQKNVTHWMLAPQPPKGE